MWLYSLFYLAIIRLLPLPYGHGREVGKHMDSFTGFVVAVAAGIVAYCICKWLDSNA